MIRGERWLHLCCIGQQRARSDIYLHIEPQTQSWPRVLSAPLSFSSSLVSHLPPCLLPSICSFVSFYWQKPLDFIQPPCAGKTVFSVAPPLSILHNLGEKIKASVNSRRMSKERLWLLWNILRACFCWLVRAACPAHLSPSKRVRCVVPNKSYRVIPLNKQK